MGLIVDSSLVSFFGVYSSELEPLTELTEHGSLCNRLQDA